MNMVGLQHVKLGGDPEVGQVWWAPDSSQLMIHYIDRNAGIGIVDANGQKFRKLAHATADYAQWSPDGTAIAIRYTPSIAEDGIYLYVFATHQLRPLYLQPNLSVFAWSPYSDQLAVVNQHAEVMVIDAVTGDELGAVAHDARSYCGIGWRPSTTEVAYVNAAGELILRSVLGASHTIHTSVTAFAWSECDDLACVKYDAAQELSFLNLNRYRRPSHTRVVRNVTVSFTGDGSRLYLAGDIRTDMVWHRGVFMIDSENRLHDVLRDDELQVVRCAVAPDGSKLALIDTKQKVHLLQLH